MPDTPTLTPSGRLIVAREAALRVHRTPDAVLEVLGLRDRRFAELTVDELRAAFTARIGPGGQGDRATPSRAPRSIPRREESHVG